MARILIFVGHERAQPHLLSCERCALDEGLPPHLYLGEGTGVCGYCGAAGRKRPSACTCIHDGDQHDEKTGRCLRAHPTLGECPCGAGQ